jgi:hypothetical protein
VPAPPAPAPAAPKSTQVWTEPAPPSFDEPADDAPAEEARQAHLILALGAHAAAGTSPRVTAGVTGGVGFWLDPFSLRAEGRADLEKSEIDEAGRGAAVQLYAVSAVPCLHVGVVEACGVLTFGSLEASNIRLSGPPSESSFYAAAGLRPGILLPLTPNWLLEVRGELAATFTPLELRSAGAEIWSLSPVSGSLGTGFVVRYP